jgi:hypothetical protein
LERAGGEVEDDMAAVAEKHMAINAIKRNFRCFILFSFYGE